jgi:hypothetical protein
MTGFQQLEKTVNTFVGTPLTWTLYGLWLAAKWCWRTAVQSAGWVYNRYTTIRRKQIVHARRTV